MKIFQINWTGEQDGEHSWISAETIIGAIQTYCSTTGMDLTDFNGDEEIVELPKEDWCMYRVTNEHGDDECSFEEWMENKDGESDVICETMNNSYEEED